MLNSLHYRLMAENQSQGFGQLEISIGIPSSQGIKAIPFDSDVFHSLKIVCFFL